VPQPYLDTYAHALQLTPDETELWVTDRITDPSAWSGSRT
jgi:hypothetical protein